MSSAPLRNRIIGHGEEEPGKLLANPRNWRIHPQAQQDALAAVLEDVGWIQEVIINKRTGFVVDGHLRVAMSISRGEPIVPVKYVDLSPEEEALVLTTFDPIAAMAAADKEQLNRLLVDISTDNEAVAKMLAELAAENGLAFGTPEPEVEDPGADFDKAEELREKWQTERGQVWVVGQHRVMCGDSTSAEDVARLMAGIRAPLMLTDPPYGISVVKGLRTTDGGSKPVTIGAIRGRKPYASEGIRNNGKRGTVGGTHLVDATLYMPVEGDDHPFDPEPYLELADNLIMFGGNYFASRLTDSRCWIVWDKNNTGNFADAELAWTSFDRGVRLYKHTWNGLVREGPREIEGVHRVHPTQKPVGLFEAILGDFSAAADIIFDPFLGSGTTLIAAEKTGRRCYGMEIEPKYVAVILERAKGIGLEPRLESNG